MSLVKILLLPAEALLPSNTPISSTTAEGSWFTGTIAVLIGAVIVCRGSLRCILQTRPGEGVSLIATVAPHCWYSEVHTYTHSQDKRLHLKEAKVKELTEQNTELQRKHHAVQVTMATTPF